MGPCPTGYCGHPCTCPSSYDHTDADACNTLIDILSKRLTQLAEDAASKVHKEPMVEYVAKVLSLKALRVHGAMQQVDIELHKFIPRKDAIYTLSGIRSLHRDGDNFVTQQGHNENAVAHIRYEIVNYYGDVTVCCTTTSAPYEITAFVELTDTKTYLPKETV